MRNLQDGDRSQIHGAGYTVNRREDVQPPSEHPRIEVLVAKPAHRLQAARPAVVIEVMDRELTGVDVDARPLWVGQCVAVANPQPKLPATIGPAPDFVDRHTEIGWRSVEPVHQEQVVGHLRRQPVRLRIDRCKPAHVHVLGQTWPTKSTMWRATASGCSSCRKCPAPSTTKTSPPGGRTRCTQAT